MGKKKSNNGNVWWGIVDKDVVMNIKEMVARVLVIDGLVKIININIKIIKSDYVRILLINHRVELCHERNSINNSLGI